MIRRPPRSTRTDTSFPTRRSSDRPTLAVTMGAASRRIAENRYDVRKVNTLLLEAMELNGGSAAPIIVSPNRGRGQRMVDILVASMAAVAAADRKSTRLNSSH